MKKRYLVALQFKDNSVKRFYITSDNIFRDMKELASKHKDVYQWSFKTVK